MLPVCAPETWLEQPSNCIEEGAYLDHLRRNTSGLNMQYQIHLGLVSINFQPVNMLRHTRIKISSWALRYPSSV